MIEGLEPRFILKAFRKGFDTQAIAYAFGISQADVCRLLWLARDAEREFQEKFPAGETVHQSA